MFLFLFFKSVTAGINFQKYPQKAVFKICSKINLVDFFSFEVYFLPTGQLGFSKHPINRLFKLGLETGFHLIVHLFLPECSEA